MKRRLTWLIAMVLAFALVASACGDDDDDDTSAGDDGAASEGDGGAASADLEGTTVTLYGPENSEEEAGALQDALDVFAEENGMTITYTGEQGAEGNLGRDRKSVV